MKDLSTKKLNNLFGDDWTVMQGQIFVALDIQTRLKVDSVLKGGYQREEQQKHYMGMAKKWNPRFCDPLVISLRKGTVDLMLLDGQQRRLALLYLNNQLASRHSAKYAKIGWKHCCRVIGETTRLEESKIFLNYNHQKSVTALNKFQACLLDPTSDQRAIAELVADADFQLQFNSRSRELDNGLRGAPVLLSAYKAHKTYFPRALKVLMETWGDVWEARHGDVVKAICAVMAQGATMATLRKVLPKQSIIKIREQAEQVKYSIHKPKFIANFIARKAKVALPFPQKCAGVTVSVTMDRSASKRSRRVAA